MRKSMLAILVLALVSTGCLSGSEVNEQCLVYSGGVVEDKEFIEFLPPGSTSNWIGFGSTTYCYRTDQRSYIASPEGEAGDTNEIIVVSKDNVSLSVPYQLYFKLNLDPDVLREFHENIGVKTEGWTDAGWVTLLNEYFRPQIERSAEAAALKHDWRTLYGSEEGRVQFQHDTVESLKRAIAQVIGDDYFCGPDYNGPDSECGEFTFTVGKPTPVDGEIVSAVEAEQKSVAETSAQEERNQRIRVELEAEQAIVDMYGAQGALLREAIRSDSIDLLPFPTDGQLLLDGRQPPAAE